jgi:hypothetical protein
MKRINGWTIDACGTDGEKKIYMVENQNGIHA